MKKAKDLKPLDVFKGRSQEDVEKIKEAQSFNPEADIADVIATLEDTGDIAKLPPPPAPPSEVMPKDQPEEWCSPNDEDGEVDDEIGPTGVW